MNEIIFDITLSHFVRNKYPTLFKIFVAYISATEGTEDFVNLKSFNFSEILLMSNLIEDYNKIRTTKIDGTNTTFFEVVSNVENISNISTIFQKLVNKIISTGTAQFQVKQIVTNLLEEKDKSDSYFFLRAFEAKNVSVQGSSFVTKLTSDTKIDSEYKAIIDSTIPDFIKEVSPALYDMFFLFVQKLEKTTDMSEKNSPFSYYYDFDPEKTPIDKEEFLIRFMQNYSRNLLDALVETTKNPQFVKDYQNLMKTNKTLPDIAFESYGSDFAKNIEEGNVFKKGYTFSEELFSLIKNMSASKGKVEAFDFFGEIASKTVFGVSNSGKANVGIAEGAGENQSPFYYTLNSDLRPAFVESFLKPLCHPVGFYALVITPLYESLYDFFDIQITKTNIKSYLSNVATQQTTDISAVWVKEFLFGVEIDHTTEDDITNLRTVVFDGSFYYVKTYGQNLKVYDLTYDYENNVGTPLSGFESFNLVLSYDYKYESTIQDSIGFGIQNFLYDYFFDASEGVYDDGMYYEKNQNEHFIWNSDQFFFASDVVFDGENQFICIADCLNVSTSDTNFWLPYQREYSDSINYPVGSLTVYNGRRYTCIQQALNKRPDINPTFWYLNDNGKKYSGFEDSTLKEVNLFNNSPFASSVDLGESDAFTTNEGDNVVILDAEINASYVLEAFQDDQLYEEDLSFVIIKEV